MKMNKEQNEFAKTVQKKLIDKEMNITDFAASLGITRSYLYAILKDERKAAGVRAKIKEVLDIK